MREMQKVDAFNQVLLSFKIKATCLNYQQIDNYFFYDLKLSPNAKIKEIQKYEDELSLALKAPCKPSFKVLYNQGLIRLEFVNPREKPLNLFDFFTNSQIPNGSINCLLGQSVDGKKIWMDIAQNPHLLIAGTTGSGKSCLLHNLIANFLNYNDIDLYLIDPKRIEFSVYENKIKSIHTGYSYDYAMHILNSAIEIMEFRYDLMRKDNNFKFKPIVIMIDEFADLILQDAENQFYISLCRLAQKCRAASIHLILSTQRPSVNIVNGAIKANFPARIACRVASQMDSKVILDASGAQNLLGKGDALLKDNFRNLERFQIAYTAPQEICKYFGSN